MNGFKCYWNLKTYITTHSLASAPFANKFHFFFLWFARPFHVTFNSEHRSRIPFVSLILIWPIFTINIQTHTFDTEIPTKNGTAFVPLISFTRKWVIKIVHCTHRWQICYIYADWFEFVVRNVPFFHLYRSRIFIKANKYQKYIKRNNK